MNNRIGVIPSRWGTASFGVSADVSSDELSALSTHAETCRESGGRLFAARCAADAVHGFLAVRFVTTLVAATILIVVASLIAA